MANYLVTDTELTSIADAIRTKGGTSESLEFPTAFVSAIGNIPSGGGGGTTCNLTISVEVVPGPPMPSMRADVKYIDSNGVLQTIAIDTGTASSETVTVPCPCIVGIGGETGIPYITGDAYMATYQYGYGATYVYGDATIQFSA